MKTVILPDFASESAVQWVTNKENEELVSISVYPKRKFIIENSDKSSKYKVHHNINDTSIIVSNAITNQIIESFRGKTTDSVKSENY